MTFRTSIGCLLAILVPVAALAAEPVPSKAPPGMRGWGSGALGLRVLLVLALLAVCFGDEDLGKIAPGRLAGGPGPLAVVAARSLGPRRQVVLVRVGRKVLVLGVSRRVCAPWNRWMRHSPRRSLAAATSLIPRPRVADSPASWPPCAPARKVARDECDTPAGRVRPAAAGLRLPVFAQAGNAPVGLTVALGGGSTGGPDMVVAIEILSLMTLLQAWPRPC